jgi:hypothetical protein
VHSASFLPGHDSCSAGVRPSPKGRWLYFKTSRTAYLFYAVGVGYTLHTPGLLEAGYELLRRRRRRLSRRRSRRLSTNDLELHIPTFAVVFRLADFHVTSFYLRLECAGQ